MAIGKCVCPVLGEEVGASHGIHFLRVHGHTVLVAHQYQPAIAAAPPAASTHAIEPSTRLTIRAEVGTISRWHNAANAATSPTSGGRPAMCPNLDSQAPVYTVAAQ